MIITYIWVKDLLYDQLKELFGYSSFIYSLLTLKLHIQLFLQVCWVFHGNHLQLKPITYPSRMTFTNDK